MKNALQEDIDVEELLAPECDLEYHFIRTPEFYKGLLWGKPRFGHPEGKVVYHIREVLDNIDLLDIPVAIRDQLRLIAFLHDTFKYKEIKNEPRDWSLHHGVFARKFAQSFISDQAVLDVIEWHDEAYYSWRHQYIHRDIKKGEQRLQKLLQGLGPNLQLYYLFFKCDTRTGDKNQAPLHWFEKTVQGITILCF